HDPEDEDEDPEEDPSEEHDPEDEDEDPEEDPSEEHEPEDEDAKEDGPLVDCHDTVGHGRLSDLGRLCQHPWRHALLTMLPY
ncbi:hypothetical protein Tco_0623720, partial [Tanacetum coccineum]